MTKPTGASRSAESRATSRGGSGHDGDAEQQQQRTSRHAPIATGQWQAGELPPHLEPPEIDRRFALYPFQWPGIILLALIPLLALFGVFGESRTTEDARAGDVALRVEWIARTRFEQIGAMDIVATNAGSRAIDTLTVTIDPAYLSRFSGLAITPSADAPFDIPLTDVAAGESRRVHVELDATHPGRHRGAVTATAGGPDTARVAIATIVFP